MPPAFDKPREPGLEGYMHVMRIPALILALISAGLTPALAEPGDRCSQQSVAVGRNTVAVSVCAGPTDGHAVPITEVFARDGKSFTRTAVLAVLPRQDVARGPDDAPLGALGLPYTMHLELAYVSAQATIERATVAVTTLALK